MTRHRWTTRKLWAGLILLLFGAGMVIASPVGAQSDSSGNVTCEALVGELDLTDVVMAKDDHGRTAPFPAEGYYTFTDNGLTVSYQFVAAPEGSPEPFVVRFTTGDDGPAIFGVYVKQAAEKQGDSRGATFPDGVTSGVVYVPVGEFSHVSFCSGTLTTPTTETPTTPTTPTTETPTTETPTTETPTTETPTTETPTTETTTTTVEGDEEVTTTTEAEEVAPTSAAPTTAAPTTAAAPAEEVAGDVVTRELPYTGAGTGVLAAVGVGMLVLGSVLVAQSSKQLREAGER